MRETSVSAVSVSSSLAEVVSPALEMSVVAPLGRLMAIGQYVFCY